MSSRREAGIQRAQDLEIGKVLEESSAHLYQVGVLGSGAEAEQHQNAVWAAAVAMAGSQLRFPPKTDIPAFQFNQGLG